MQETWVRSLDWEDPLEEGMATHSSILAWRIPMDRGAWWAAVHRVSELDTTERLSAAHRAGMGLGQRGLLSYTLPTAALLGSERRKNLWVYQVTMKNCSHLKPKPQIFQSLSTWFQRLAEGKEQARPWTSGILGVQGTGFLLLLSPVEETAA